MRPVRRAASWGVVALLLLPAPAAARAAERALTPLSQAVDHAKRLLGEFAPYDVVFRRDPMRALVDAQGELVTSTGLHGGLSVDGIIWSAEHPLAVIDDELVASGQTVGPYAVLQIQADGVVVQRPGQTQALFVPLDRGLETRQEYPVDPASLQPLPADAASPQD